jgi:putative ABC transport system permease protein
MPRPPRRYFRLPFSSATLQRDIDEEVTFHLEARVADLMAAGHSESFARESAMREFGDVAEAKADLRDLGRQRLRRMRLADAWDAFRQDVRYAVRGIAREPGIAAAVMLTLALGVGANATMFGVTDELLLRPPAGVVDPESIVRIGFDQRNRVTGEVRSVAATTFRTFDALREELAGVQLAAFSPGGERSLGRGSEARSVRLASATHNYFNVLGVQPAVGRFFSAEEDAPPAGSEVAVVSWSFWQNHFGGASDVLGRTLEINRRTYTVVGVAPRDFNGLDVRRVDLWVPVATTAAEMSPTWHSEHNVWFLRVIGRLAPGVSPEAIAAHATIVDTREHPAKYERDDAARVSVGPLVGTRTIGTSPEQERANRVAVWLLGVSGVVMLIACANVANLLLARALRRRRETECASRSELVAADSFRRC